jgi:transcriptional regulator with XRE-family HTH domain
MTYTEEQFNQRKAYARELGASIRYWREFRGYTHEQLARELDLSDDALISRYEAGKVEMPVYRLAQIAFHLAIPVQSLIPSPHDPEAAFGSGPCKTYTDAS